MTMVLAAEGLFKSYSDTQKRVNVLDGVDFSVAAGESVAVVGPSGAGKSTLLHILGGLDVPDRGRVLFHGRDVYRMPDAERARLRNAAVGFVFQFYHLLPELTALENVMLPLMVAGGPDLRAGTAQTRASSRLRDVGLGDRMDHKPNQLSGGEQQRVAVARALINDPEVLCCDEPTGNLDSASGAVVMDLLFSLNARDRRALVVVTHDDVLARRASRMARIRDGRMAPAV